MSEKLMQADVIHSTAYGEIPIQPDQVYFFNQGIIGFTGEKKYALLPLADTDLFILHSCNDKDVSFIIIPATKVSREFSFQIDTETIELLELNEPGDVVTFLIVHIADNQLFINAKAPLLLVPSTHKGCQFVIHDPNYAVRESLEIKDDSSC